jgi:hypothetical protein
MLAKCERRRDLSRDESHKFLYVIPCLNAVTGREVKRTLPQLGRRSRSQLVYVLGSTSRSIVHQSVRPANSVSASITPRPRAENEMMDSNFARNQNRQPDI